MLGVGIKGGGQSFQFWIIEYEYKSPLFLLIVSSAPLGPTDIYNSPYSSISTFAGNPLLISFELLIEDGLLDPALLANYKKNNPDKILFKDLIDFKIPILNEISMQFEINASSEMKISFNQFCENNSYWLDDYSNYYALKIENQYTSWINWRSHIVKNEENIYQAKIIQFIFHEQWSRLQKYCTTHGVEIIGDMPIYVGYDSSDVYFNRDLFQLDNYGKMKYQGGCPPCEFQENGQLWGTPLYDWDKHSQNNFKWWKKRFKKLFEMVDIIRLDHFIGYTKYYSIPINDKTAHNGKWNKAPGNQLFDILKSSFPNFSVIAEDLGDATLDVINLRDEFQFPGMLVLQFEIEKMLSKKDFRSNSIVCTGTHDNDTLLGWIDSLKDSDSNKNIFTKSKLLELFNLDFFSYHSVDNNR